jgi:glucose/arabinose dehydrogenase
MFVVYGLMRRPMMTNLVFSVICGRVMSCSNLCRCCTLILLAVAVLPSSAQVPAGLTPPPAAPIVADTDTGQRIRIVPVATGLSHPWSMAFLPDGALLVTERPGRLRIIRNGLLDPRPIDGVPAVNSTYIGGLNEVSLDPDFATNRLVYLSYTKSGELGATLALARGRWNGSALVEVQDIFVADAWEQAGMSAATGGGTYGGRIAFGPDKTLYLTVGDRDTRVQGNDNSVRWRAQSGVQTMNWRSQHDYRKQVEGGGRTHEGRDHSLSGAGASGRSSQR